MLADGDVNVGFEEVVLKAEEFQEREDRHFGMTRSDLREIFLCGWAIGLVGCRFPLEERLKAAWKRFSFDGIRLGEIIPVVLHFDEADFSERESLLVRHEVATREEYESHDCESWYGCSWEEYRRKLSIKQEMRRVFGDSELPQVEAVRQFMNRHGLDDRLLQRCSGPGEAH